MVTPDLKTLISQIVDNLSSFSELELNIKIEKGRIYFKIEGHIGTDQSHETPPPPPETPDPTDYYPSDD